LAVAAYVNWDSSALAASWPEWFSLDGDPSILDRIVFVLALLALVMRKGTGLF